MKGGDSELPSGGAAARAGANRESSSLETHHGDSFMARSLLWVFVFFLLLLLLLVLMKPARSHFPIHPQTAQVDLGVPTTAGFRTGPREERRGSRRGLEEEEKS